ncbi:MAG: hypothetical protein LBT64_02975 [Puniceicoccales bacterium]|jgi:type II secretory pathway component GspD/PulD (secretin)|nr:hypothetical protein [Puniceicoccales bacterium]
MKNMKKQILIFVFLLLGMQFISADEEYSSEEDNVVVKNVALSGAPLAEVLFVLEELSGKPVIRDNRLQNIFIDLQIRHTMTKEEAILAIESALAINNVAIVELGDGLLKAINAQAASAQSPHFIEHSLLNATPSEKICSKIFQLMYLPVSEFSTLITPLLNADRSSTVVFDDSNSILITDSISNLQRIELILSKVDIPKHSVITSKIFRVKHGDAKDIAELLNKVINGRITKDSQSKTPSVEGVALDFAKEITPFQFSKNLTIEHDVRSNSIVVCGTQKDIEHVESIVNQIDVLLDQVRIEVIIVNVKLSNGQATGLESFTFDHNTHSSNIFDKEVRGSNHGNATGDKIGLVHHGSFALSDGTIGSATAAAQSIFNIGANLKKFSLETIFRKAREDKNIKVLSSPTIVTTHNREALIKIVESRPVVTSDISEVGATAMKSTVDYKDIGIELRVKPLIGINGVIQLEIKQNVETIDGEIKISGNAMPTTSRREAMSFVSVCDGDTVVLAGLQEKKTTRNDGKLWILGDIPIIGKLLFSPKSRIEETTELIVFIKPTIVSNPANEESFAKRILDGSLAKPDVDHYNATGKFLPTAPMPELTISDPNYDIHPGPKHYRREERRARARKNRRADGLSHSRYCDRGDIPCEYPQEDDGAYECPQDEDAYEYQQDDGACEYPQEEDVGQPEYAYNYNARRAAIRQQRELRAAQARKVPAAEPTARVRKPARVSRSERAADVARADQKKLTNAGNRRSRRMEIGLNKKMPAVTPAKAKNKDNGGTRRVRSTVNKSDKKAHEDRAMANYMNIIQAREGRR